MLFEVVVVEVDEQVLGEVEKAMQDDEPLLMDDRIRYDEAPLAADAVAVVAAVDVDEVVVAAVVEEQCSEEVHHYVHYMNEEAKVHELHLDVVASLRYVNFSKIQVHLPTLYDA